jgi:predicted ATP-grasp superfamily ATP-dependent carboligase
MSHSTLPESFTNEVRDNLLDPGLFVAGPLAIMLGYLDMSMFPASGLLAYAQRDRPDPSGAIVIIKKLNELLKISVETEELSSNAKAIEEEIKKQLAPIEENQAEDLSSKRIYT